MENFTEVLPIAQSLRRYSDRLLIVIHCLEWNAGLSTEFRNARQCGRILFVTSQLSTPCLDGQRLPFLQANVGPIQMQPPQLLALGGRELFLSLQQRHSF